jgi:hypothetical protein
MGFLVFAALDVDTQGLPQRFSPEVAAMTREVKRPDLDDVWACESAPANNPCVVGASVRPTYAIWGDSHAVVMVPAIATMAGRHGKAVEVFIQGSCPPVVGFYPSSQKSDARCFSRNIEVMKSLELSREIETVILVAHYSHYVDAGSAVVFARQLSLTIDQLQAAGRTVVIVYPVPDFPVPVTRALGMLIATGRDPASLSVPRVSFDKSQELAFSALDKLENSKQLVRIWPHKRLCNAERCLAFANGQTLYSDEEHLSEAGANFIISEFETIFDKGSLVTVGFPSR